MRILVVTHYFREHGGGIERVAAELSARFARAGHEVVWAATDQAGAGASRSEGVERLALHAANITERSIGLPYPVLSPAAARTLFRAVRKADVVHAHDGLYTTTVVAAAGARRYDRPLVVTQHVGHVPYRHPLPRYAMAAANRSVARGVLSRAERVVFISRQVEQYFATFIAFHRESQFVPNGVDLEAFRPTPPGARATRRRSRGWSADRPVALFVGRFVEKKGVDVIQALARRLPDVRWVLAGEGVANAADWGLANVEPVGAVNRRQLADLYADADFLVLPSMGEGFPLVIQEAIACGTPVLISDDCAAGYPPVREVAAVGAPTADVFERLVREAVQATQSDAGAERHDLRAFAEQHWNWESCAAAYTNLFADITRRRKP